MLRVLLIAIFMFARPAFALTIERIGGVIEHPWGVTVLNDREVVVTSRSGSIYLVDIVTGEQRSLEPLPSVAVNRQGGMLDIVAAPHNDGYRLYYCYSKPVGWGATVAIDQVDLVNGLLSHTQTLFQSNHSTDSGVHFGCRLALVGAELFASLGDRGDRENSQLPSHHAGSVVRIDLKKTSPQEPLKSGWLPEIYSIGHRNPQGLAIHPETGQLWSHEHGPRGGDELNLIKAGHNYGWPLVSYGKEYFGGDIGLNRSPEGFVDPAWVWTPSIAPSGMLFYTADMFPEWQGDLLVGALKYESIYHLEWDATLNKPTRETRLFEGQFGRIRDIEQLPDGSLLVLSDAKKGALHRLSQ